MRTRIALVTVFAVALIVTISTVSVARPAPSQSGATAPRQKPSSTTLLRGSTSEQAGQLVAFHAIASGRITGRRTESTITGLGQSLSLVAEQLAASGTKPAPVAAPAPAPVAAPAPAPAPVAAPAPAPAPAPVPVTDATSTATADWQCIRIHESSDRYNDPSAPSGAYGIVPVTWASYGYSGWPYQAPAAVQDALALRLYNQYGWQPWSSRFACGL